jgi:O-antigen/teichoic acid export membrane protein
VSLKRNVIANYLGQGWKALMAFVFIPVYIHYLGMESFALVGIFGMLQAWLTLLDMGMKPALGREMARFSAGRYDPEFIRDLLKSVLIVGLAMAATIAAGVWAASGWLASDWLTARQLPIDVVAEAIAWMGVVVASRFIENIYVNCMVGLQQQVIQNAVTAALATLRGAGVIGVLAWISPTIGAFFIWQGLVSLLSIAVFSNLVYRTLPTGSRPARFSWSALSHVWRFASGMMAIALLALLLTQVDKILLSRMLTLEAFGYYALAATVATALKLIATPITTAIYPRFTQLASRECGEPALRILYHHSAQLITVLMGSAASVLIVFSYPILLLWTGNPTVTREAAPILSVLALGTLLNGLMWIPYQLQLAYGWTALAIRINTIAVACLVPSLFWLVPHFGSMGAAWAWVALNVGYLMSTVHFMHRHLLVGEKWHWYASDIAVPLGATFAAATICRWAIPIGLGRAGELVALSLASGFVLLSALLAAPLVREQACRQLLSFLKPSEPSTR